MTIFVICGRDTSSTAGRLWGIASGANLSQQLDILDANFGRCHNHQMTDTILKQGECFTIALTTKLGPAVPYPAVDHHEGHINHGFVDVRGRPDMIAQIPEAIGKPGLIELLQFINDDVSPIMSVGCENGVFPATNQNPDGPTCYIGSYIDVAFQLPDRNTQEAIIELANKIIQERKPEARQWTNFELLIQPMRHFFGNPAHNLCLKIAANGRSEEGAWTVFNAQCRMMIGSLKRIFEEVSSSE